MCADFSAAKQNHWESDLPYIIYPCCWYGCLFASILWFTLKGPDALFRRRVKMTATLIIEYLLSIFVPFIFSPVQAKKLKQTSQTATGPLKAVLWVLK